MTDSPLKRLRLKGKSLLPIVQGGMGVGVSSHRLAGAVAREGAVGTIASIDLRHHHPDLLARTRDCRDQVRIDAANCEALDREIRAAHTVAEGEGLVAVNVMKAVTSHAELVRQSCESGADAIVMGAGLPFDLPELTADHPEVALIPILSEARGIGVLVKRWMRRNRLPDAIVIEHPRYAGGHLGVARAEDVGEERFDFRRVLESAFELWREYGIEREAIPLIPAGGINSHEKVAELLAMGAAAVQVGTPFAVTEESDAHPNFKRVLARARPEQIITFMSAAGLPARAVLTPWLKRYLEMESRLQERAGRFRDRCASAFNCLSHCGLRDGIAKMGQFCIDAQLAAALKGDVERGLFFRGSESLPFGEQIRPVRELLDYLLNGTKPVPSRA
ncbi:MAG: nitronate monooxygenase family protein [Acidobacteria bacterium]|jgi:nitronate monooxygenase|nr:nitronate monooxygenase family protein [Acidobacteriota bacterium]